MIMKMNDIWQNNNEKVNEQNKLNGSIRCKLKDDYLGDNKSNIHYK